MSPSWVGRARIRVLSFISASLVLSIVCGVVGQRLSAAFSSSISLGQEKLIRPSASPAPTGIRTIALTTNDLVFDPAGQRIYASLPSTAANGNSLVQIDPYAGTVGTPVPIGSEPTRLAISDNSQYIYAGLNGVGAVRRFDIASQTPGLQFSLGVTEFFQTIQSAEDLAVMPGQPNTVAVSRKAMGSPRSHGVAIFDNGVMRPNTTPTTGTSINPIEFSSSPTTLYGYNNESTEFGFRQMTIDSNGVTIKSTTQSLLVGGDVDMRYANGLIYATSGRVIDPEALTLTGTFQDASSQAFPFDTLVLPDPSANRVYFLISSLSGSTTTWTLKAFNLTTFVLTGSLTMPGVSGTPTSLIKWGDDGLAFRTSGNQVYLFSTADIVRGVTPTPTPVQLAAGITMLPLASGDLAYDPNTQKVYASVPSAAGSFGNSIVPIDPTTGVMGVPVFVGSEPGKLSITDNHQYLYAGLNGAGALRRFDLGLGSAGPQYPLGVVANSGGVLFPTDLQVLPGSTNSVAVSRKFSNLSPSEAGVGIYDDGVVRPTAASVFAGNRLIEFSSSAGALYGYDVQSSGSTGFRKMALNPSGVSVVATNTAALGDDFKYDNGNVYGANGRVINPETVATLGTFSGANSLGFVPDASVNRVFFATIIGSSVTLQAFDEQTFGLVGTLSIPGVVGSPVGMVRWGADGLAMRTSGNQIYFIKTSLVPAVVKSATSTAITSSQNPINAGQSVTFTATVTSASGTPTGTVQFRDGATNLGSQTLTGGSASVTTSTLAAGLRTITADYSGDANFLVSAATLAGSETVIPSLSINDVSITEGDFGTKNLAFTVTLSAASNQTVKVDYATADGTAIAGSDYVAMSGTLTFNSTDPLTKTVLVTINGDQSFEPDETLFLNLSNPANANLGKGQGKGTILNDDFQGGAISFNNGSYSSTESAGVITVRINRGNDVSRAATVDYATSDTGAPASCGTSNGLASSRCDFISAAGTLRFEPGDTQKTFTVLVNSDAYNEGSETFGINLSNPTGGAVILGSSTASGIIFNSTAGPANVIDDATTFVRQHYRDFLNRAADSDGLVFWSNEITSCGSDAACIEVKRINVSAAFFLSIEFQQTGYLVERFYKVTYGDDIGSSTIGFNHQLAVPIVRLSEFLRDTQRLGQGVVVNAPGWEQVLETNKQAYAFEFVQTSRFSTALPTAMTPAQFVDRLNQNAGNVLSSAERSTAINLFGSAGDTSNATARAQALRMVAEDPDLVTAESNRAFVLAQYFGYLRRNPNDVPDSDYTGYDFWLTKLNQFNGDYIAAEMVKAFISSSEYRQRFGP
jgi:hypothetical protein